MAAKVSSIFVCQECGYESIQYLGKCPQCGNWNSLKEFKTVKEPSSKTSLGPQRAVTIQTDVRIKTLSEISDISNKYSKKSITQNRLLTGFSEMDTVLGGGIVKGEVILLAGDPGVGKSTILLQLALNIAGDSNHQNKNESGQISRSVLYISGEESEEQIAMRAKRLNGFSNSSSLELLSLTNTDQAAKMIQNRSPDVVIIDSIQTMEGEFVGGLAGSIAQVRYAAFSFIHLAKTLGIPVILVGHVTKEGMVAGPMVLSHMVDTVLFLEGEKNTGTRILRSFKNRFGPVDEVGIFIMESVGMKELKNPETLFLSQKKFDVPGSVLTVTLEGTRAFLVEIQALVVFTKLPMPRRIVSGLDRSRVELLLAVLQKHCKLPLDTMDVFVNVAGGLKLSDPAADLGVCLAIYSSLKNVPMSKIVGISEIGLLGELRSVPMLEKRIRQSQKLGFNNIITNKDFQTLSNVVQSVGKEPSESAQWQERGRKIVRSSS